MPSKLIMKPACLACGLLFLGAAQAQTRYEENFSGVTTQLSWKALGTNACCNADGSAQTALLTDPACLTASGNGPDNTGVYGNIPKCSGNRLSYRDDFSGKYSTPYTQPNDPAGYGALRLTPARRYQTGAVLSNFTFQTHQGVQITFTTYTYNGSQNGGAGALPSANNGADGISFILTNGSDGIPMPAATGASGGSLGYSCSNAATVYEGMAHAYLGLGIDEWGNFLNSFATTNTGILNTNNSGYAATMAALGLATDALGGNGWAKNTAQNAPGSSTGREYQAMRIGLRGAGNTTWAWLNSMNPLYYGSIPNATKFWNACKTGKYVTNSTGSTTANITYNYKAIPGGYYVLNDSQPIASITGKRRVNADGTSNPEVYPITYKLSLSPSGLLNFSFSYNNGLYQPVISNRQITDDNGPLPDWLRFGFTASTGGSTNVHEITCFQVTPTTSNSSPGGNSTSGEVQIGSQIYLASYAQNDWTGTVRAVPVTIDGATGNLGLSPIPNWDAGCALTGGYCPATDAGSGTTNATGNYTPWPQPGGNTTGSERVLLTSDSATGLGKAFGALNADETMALGGSAQAPAVTAWLRGDRSQEQLWGTKPGNLRARTGVLGDIINSSPTWVGPPQANAFPDALTDSIHPSDDPAPEAVTKFSAYVSSAAGRQAVVYVGSNDGFLHGFRTGAVDAVADSPNNDGREVLGFMPSGQLLKYAAGLASPLYSHSYVVDATPGAGDLFYGGAWHTWLVGGVGSAGQEIYALNVTDPASFSENKAASLVVGDWTASATQLSRLNCTVGTPVIARLHNGQWAIIFGNGLPDNLTPSNCKQKANTYTAGIYIGLVDKNTGAVSFTGVGAAGFLETGQGTSATPNGIAEINVVDVDHDGIADYVYGGDALGNVWRFDLSSTDPAQWAVSTFGTGGPAPLFNAGQPITTAPVVASVTPGSQARMMVYFGTGRLIPATTAGGAAYATGAQTFYGIWDWDWSGTPWKAHFASLPAAPSPAIDKTSLLKQTATQTGATRSLGVGGAVCWADQSSCASNKQYGWQFNLPDTNEQIIYNPVTVGAAIVVNTAKPPMINAQACNPGRQSGWTMAFNPETGGGFERGFFHDADGNFGFGSAGIAGLYQNAVGSPYVLTHQSSTFLILQTSDGNSATPQINPPADSTPARASWRELKL